MKKLFVALLNMVIVMITLFMISLYYALSEALDPTLSDCEIHYAMFKLVYPNLVSVLIVFGILFFINKSPYNVKQCLYIYLFSVVLSLLVISFWAIDYYFKTINRRERIELLPAYLIETI